MNTSFDITDIDPTWSSPYKGFCYETIVQKRLETSNISFDGNSSTFKLWKKTTIKGYDITVQLSDNKSVSIECKLSLKPLKHEYIVNDWLPRSADVIVTNNIFNVSSEDRQLIRESGKELISTDDLCTYLIEFRNKLILGNGMDGKWYNAKYTSFLTVKNLKEAISLIAEPFLGLKYPINKLKLAKAPSTTNYSLNVT
jgi:hypothetical protein